MREGWINGGGQDEGRMGVWMEEWVDGQMKEGWRNFIEGEEGGKEGRGGDR